MKEAKKGECKKCKNYFYVDAHHILPKSIFGKGDTVDLCPNCHRLVHEDMKKEIKEKKNANEILKFFRNWIQKPLIIAFFIIGIYFLKTYFSKF